MTSYRPRTAPRAHQLEALRRLRSKPQHPTSADVFALLMEMGTGKSKVIVDEFGERATSRDLCDLLIIAPAGSYMNWVHDRGEDDPSELRKHLSEELFDRCAMIEWRSGGLNSERRYKLERFLSTDRPRVLSINVEALSTVQACEQVVRLFLERGRTLMVIDESTKIKNGDAIRTGVINHVLGPLAPARRILTGLVTPNSPMDLYSQFSFLDWRILGFRDYYPFRARYAVMRHVELSPHHPQAGKNRGRGPLTIVNYKNLDELYGKIEPYSYRVLKEECLDLPKKQYVIRDVEWHPEQRRVYLEMREFAIAVLSAESRVTANMVLHQRLRLNQILCGFTTDDDGVERPIPERRSDALMDILYEAQGKVTIWTSHDYCIRALGEKISKKFGPQSVARFWGGNRNTRHLDEARYKRDPACQFMLATQSAGGMGNTWTMAGTNVYYNNSDKLDDRLQSEDRTHRDGLVGEYGAGFALYIDLVCESSTDMKKLRALRSKLNIASLIQGDGYREWLID